MHSSSIASHPRSWSASVAVVASFSLGLAACASTGDSRPSSQTVAPGASGTFTGLCTAPTGPGTYTMQWQPNRSGTPFGEKSPLLSITVVQSADVWKLSVWS